MSLKIVFMGTSEFSVPTLEALIKNKFNIIKVYTQPPKKSRRGQKINPSTIEEFSKKNKLNFRNPVNLNIDETNPPQKPKIANNLCNSNANIMKIR